jgi:RNA polymerase sigma-70 factor (ECF subfamily)
MAVVTKDFESIWQEYERELSSYVLSRVGDIEVQKELMQELAIKIFTSLHLQKKHLRGWLYQLTKNIIIDHYRKTNRPLPKLEVEVEHEAYVLEACLSPMLNKLTSQEEEILNLTQLQQYSLKEVATEKNLPLNTVKSQLFRAKKALAHNLFSCCEYERNSRGEVVDFLDCESGCDL